MSSASLLRAIINEHGWLRVLSDTDGSPIVLSDTLYIKTMQIFVFYATFIFLHNVF